MVKALFSFFVFLPLAFAIDMPGDEVFGPPPAPQSKSVAQPQEEEVVDPDQLNEYNEELERNFPLRSLGRLSVVNGRGSIQIQGWALDKIRVTIRKTVSAKTDELAETYLKEIDLRYKEGGGNIELSAQYGRNLGIRDRLAERASPRGTMDLVVLAPAGLELFIWAVEGEVKVESWSEDISVRSSEGTISVSNVSNSLTSINCNKCKINLDTVKGSLRAVGGKGLIRVNGLQGRDVYVETNQGNMDLSRVDGNQIYVSDSGEIKGDKLSGQIEFRTQDGGVNIGSSGGSVSGSTDSGPILIGMSRWQVPERALIESKEGPIQLSLPESLSAQIDVGSYYGLAKLEFPFRKQTVRGFSGPLPANRFQGIVGLGGHELRVFSEKGNVALLRGSVSGNPRPGVRSKDDGNDPR